METAFIGMMENSLVGLNKKNVRRLLKKIGNQVIRMVRLLMKANMLERRGKGNIIIICWI